MCWASRHHTLASGHERLSSTEETSAARRAYQTDSQPCWWPAVPRRLSLGLQPLVPNFPYWVEPPPSGTLGWWLSWVGRKPDTGSLACAIWNYIYPLLCAHKMEAYLIPLAIFLTTSNLSFPSPRDHQHHVHTCPVPSCVFVFTFMVQFLKKLLIFLPPYLSTFKNLSPFQIKNNEGWRCSSVTESLTSMHKIPTSISRTACLVVGIGFENLVIRV